MFALRRLPTRLPLSPTRALTSSASRLRSSSNSNSNDGTSKSPPGFGPAKTGASPPSPLAGFGSPQSSSPARVDAMTGEVVAIDDITPDLLTVERTTNPRPVPPSSELIFGRTFSDHMLSIPWSFTTGWSPPRIHPYEPLVLDPSCTVFHYGACLFEGLKAFKDRNGGVRLFRPDMNMKRMNRSASRLAFPNFSETALVDLIKRLVALDSHWIPSEPGHSLYIRPTMIATQAGLGVAPSTDMLLFVITSPVGPYYRTGFKPVSLYASNTDVRAWPGGTGSYKIGANYAGGLVPQLKAAREGYQQILWLFGEEDEVTEVGTMNLFVVIEQKDGSTELITPPLGDIILPGVVRDSVLSLARSHSSSSDNFALAGLPPNLVVSERKLTMPEIRTAAKEGRLKEMFGTGTAAIVSPVNNVGYNGENLQINVGEDGLGDVARVMLREITGRQLGEIESDWSVLVD